MRINLEAIFILLLSLQLVSCTQQDETFDLIPQDPNEEIIVADSVDLPNVKFDSVPNDFEFFDEECLIVQIKEVKSVIDFNRFHNKSRFFYNEQEVIDSILTYCCDSLIPSDSEKYFYNELGHLDSVVSYNLAENKPIIKHFFNYEGDFIKEVRINAAGKNENFSSQSFIRFEYDPFGKVFRKTREVQNDRILLDIYHWSNGNVVRIDQFLDGKLHVMKTYDYDDKPNYIRIGSINKLLSPELSSKNNIIFTKCDVPEADYEVYCENGCSSIIEYGFDCDFPSFITTELNSSIISTAIEYR